MKYIWNVCQFALDQSSLHFITLTGDHIALLRISVQLVSLTNAKRTTTFQSLIIVNGWWWMVSEPLEKCHMEPVLTDISLSRHSCVYLCVIWKKPTCRSRIRLDNNWQQVCSTRAKHWLGECEECGLYRPFVNIALVNTSKTFSCVRWWRKKSITS